MSTMEQLAAALRSLQNDLEMLGDCPSLLPADKLVALHSQFEENVSGINDLVKVIIAAIKDHGLDKMARAFNDYKWDAIVPGDDEFEPDITVHHTLIEILCDIRSESFQNLASGHFADIYKVVAAASLTVIRNLFSHFPGAITLHDAKLPAHSDSFTQPLVYALDAADTDLAKTLVSQLQHIGYVMPEVYGEYVKSMKGEDPAYDAALKLYNSFHSVGSPARITEASPAGGVLGSPYGGGGFFFAAAAMSAAKEDGYMLLEDAGVSGRDGADSGGAPLVCVPGGF